MNGNPGNLYFSEDTICAPFTPRGRGAMCALRLSGPKAFSITENLFTAGSKKDNQDRILHLGIFRDGDFEIDRPLAVRFTNPNSFTGEDVVEFHLHGSPYVMDQVIRALVKHGAREAMPGEFSLRAYLNGRMDLTQSEGLSELINSKTEGQHKSALSHLSGGLKERISDLRKELLRALGAIEVTFDHPGDALEAESFNPVEPLLNLLSKINVLIATHDRGRLVRDGIRIGIFGKPNVGKSSLMNRFLGKKRALVSEEPGTTRDVIDATLEIGGIEVRIIDTAGFRSGASGLEAEGQALARDELATADIRLLLLDQSNELNFDDESLLSMNSGIKGIIVLNKSDLPSGIDMDRIEKISHDNQMVSISCETGNGIDELFSEIEGLILSDNTESSDIIITSSRHYTALNGAKDCLEKALEILSDKMPQDIAALELRIGAERLGSITGGDFTEDLYSTIFSEFCLGK